MQSNMNVEYFGINIESIIENVETHFDVYTLFDLENKKPSKPSDLLLYAKAPYRWNLQELRELTALGIKNLYIENSQKEIYERYLKTNAITQQIDLKLAPKMRIQRIQDIGIHLMELSFIGELNTVLIDKLKTVCEDLVTCLIEDPGSVRYAQGLAEHDLYTYVHSVGVGALSAAIALHLGEKNPNALRDMALSGILHDVGKKMLPLNVLNKPGPLNQEEWCLMKNHPDEGHKLLKHLNLPAQVMQAVHLHHEKMDGSGYPNGLMGNKIPQHVQIVTVADIFNALTTVRPYHAQRTRFEALMLMKHNMGNKLAPEAFKGLVMAFISDKDSNVL